MKLYFKPMPWLTVIVAVCLAILISLGTWQYQRLQWKTALLAEVEAAVTAPPFTSLEDLHHAVEKGEPVDFRRIEFTATPLAASPVYAVYAPQKGGIYWDLFRQYDSSPGIFGRYDRVPDNAKPEAMALMPAQLSSDTAIGYVRKAHDMGKVESKIKSQANPESNRWFKFNQSSDWGQGEVMTSHYIDITEFRSLVEGRLKADSLPIKRPDIRNNHLDYMLTWYSFAIILLIIYFILHRRAGRLKFS